MSTVFFAARLGPYTRQWITQLICITRHSECRAGVRQRQCRAGVRQRQCRAGVRQRPLAFMGPTTSRAVCTHRMHGHTCAYEAHAETMYMKWPRHRSSLRAPMDGQSCLCAALYRGAIWLAGCICVGVGEMVLRMDPLGRRRLHSTGLYLGPLP